MFNDLNSYLAIVTAILMVGDVTGGTIKALETHSIQSSISKKGLLEKLKIFIGISTLWIAVEILAYAENNTDLLSIVSAFWFVGILNEINSIIELLGSKYAFLKNEFNNLDGGKDDGRPKK